MIYSEAYLNKNFNLEIKDESNNETQMVINVTFKTSSE